MEGEAEVGEVGEDMRGGTRWDIEEEELKLIKIEEK